jgi:uncharacterized protein
VAPLPERRVYQFSPTFQRLALPLRAAMSEQKRTKWSKMQPKTTSKLELSRATKNQIFQYDANKMERNLR